MKMVLLRSLCAPLLAIPVIGPVLSPAGAVLVEADLDGLPTLMELVNLPARTMAGEGGRPVDVVGGTSSSSVGTGRAKGNAYRADISVFLNKAEFWLDFTSMQTLSYYVFVSPVEFGTYTEIHRHSESVTGSGAAWYSTGPIYVPLNAGYYYIIAVSWSGTLRYYFSSGDSQATSFGAHVHGHASGYHPLPTTIQSSANDQAIYYQQLTTTGVSPAERSTWGAIKALYR